MSTAFVIDKNANIARTDEDVLAGVQLEFAESVQRHLEFRRAAASDGTSAPASIDDARSTHHLDEAMRRHIEAALRKTYGRIAGPTGAAGLLGINPNTLRGRMRKLRIDWRKYRSLTLADDLPSAGPT